MSDTKALVAWLRARENDYRQWASMLREQDGRPGEVDSANADKYGQAAATIERLEADVKAERRRYDELAAVAKKAIAS